LLALKPVFYSFTGSRASSLLIFVFISLLAIIMEYFSIKPKRDTELKSKFKTEICRNWTQGCCEFGDKCIFAHGSEELRNKEYLAVNYRTKKCKQFHEQGFCQYGSRCQFKHVDICESGTSNESEKTAPSSPREPSPRETRKRLPVFVRLTGEE